MNRDGLSDNISGSVVYSDFGKLGACIKTLSRFSNLTVISQGFNFLCEPPSGYYIDYNSVVVFQDDNLDGSNELFSPDDDGDGVLDYSDAFPNDDSETADDDGDGVGNNADAFPNNSSVSRDSD